MITGTVTAHHEALIPIEIEGPTGERANVQAAIDTGFTDYLTVPSSLARQLLLPAAGAKSVVLADGSETTVPLRVAMVHWHDQPTYVPVLQAEGGVLVGMALLEGSDVAMRVVEGGEVRISPV